MKINIDEIQNITVLLLSKLKQSKGNEIEIKSDFYWDISNEEVYNPYEQPKNLSLGQLSDDFNELQRLLKSNEVIIYDLKRISEILKALSIENPTSF